MSNGQDVADFLGRGTEPAFVTLAAQTSAIITAMARAYTRGGGFDTEVQGFPSEDLAAVIVTATARLMANPSQINQTVGAFSISGGFSGWNLAETFVLNRYRKRAQ